MTSGWRYRVLAAAGSAALTVLSVAIASHPAVEAAMDLVPLLRRLSLGPAAPGRLLSEAATATVAVLAALIPLYKPRPRRILDTISLAQKRVFLATIGLAAIGYFDYTYRLPRLTLILTSVMLFAFIPAWFLVIRRKPQESGGRAIIVGDDPETIADILEAAEQSVLGYVSPPSAYYGDEVPDVAAPGYTDGGAMGDFDDLSCLGGLSRLDEVLVDYDVDAALLAFARPDREEFFGTLDTCYEHGVAAKVHRNHADAVLTHSVEKGPLIDVNLEPWDWQDHVFKRAFDVFFAAGTLLALSPVILAVAIAVKLEDGGPILYGQERTAWMGGTFQVYKFRSMIPDAESQSGVKLSEEDAGRVDPRVTRVGRFIRQTHIDEIPQLWSILIGEMSVVGPRPERPELDRDMELDADQWRSRWFVKPGLTGLAQINGVTGHNPEQKLRYDVEYIRNQSFWFDLKIVVRQVWQVLEDAASLLQAG